jgi:putative transposase
VPRLKAAGPNEAWSWVITYLPTTVRGVWLYLYLVIDVWSRKVVALDVAEREHLTIAADLASRAFTPDRISRGRKQPLILHADNGNAMRAATLASRLEELGVLRSFSRPRVSNDNSYSESLFRTVKYRPYYPRRPFANKDESCKWVSSFADWYNQRHRHNGIKFVAPHRRHIGQAVEICVTALSSTNRPASPIHCAGHERSAVGVSHQWFGSTHCQQTLNPHQLR